MFWDIVCALIFVFIGLPLILPVILTVIQGIFSLFEGSSEGRLVELSPKIDPVQEKPSSDDELFLLAAEILIRSQKGSASLLQRKLLIGYNRAAYLLDRMEEVGIVGPANGSHPREVLMKDFEELKTIQNQR